MLNFRGVVKHRPPPGGLVVKYSLEYPKAKL